MVDLAEATATELVGLLASNSVTSRDIAEACIERTTRLEPLLNAWAFFDPALALAQADKCDAQDRDTITPFMGVPMGVKDIFNTRDMPTQMGSSLWEGFMPGNDARVVETLRWHGCFVLGKTVTAEFGIHAPGPTVHPLDPTRSPGTSSSGSAVAVATGMVPVALGSQTAGSTSRPASYNGIYGFKPSFGMIPRTGILKTCDTLDHVAFLARGVTDIGLLLESARVSGRDYPIVANRVDAKKNLSSNKACWKIGFVRGPKWDEAEPYAQAAIERFVDDLRNQSFVNLNEVPLPESYSHIHEAHETLYNRAVAYYFTRESLQLDLTSLSFQEMVERGRNITSEQYWRALDFQRELATDFNERLQDFDILVTLATGGEAMVGLDSGDRPDNCLVWTFLGTPALTTPAFTGPSGLPFGAQFVGRRFDDLNILAFAERLADAGLIEGNVTPRDVSREVKH